MTDTQLAFCIYKHFGIPPNWWPEHFRYDARHDGNKLRANVRRTYLQIFSSLRGG